MIRLFNNSCADNTNGDLHSSANKQNKSLNKRHFETNRFKSPFNN